MMHVANSTKTTVAAIRRQLEGVAGVAALDIDLRDDGLPRVRVRLDGTVSSNEVGDEIRRRLAVAEPAEPPDTGRRSGLGRGLSDILAAGAEVEPPRQLQPAVAVESPAANPRLTLIAVEETAGGVSVRAADSAGGLAFSPVEDQRSLNQAVVSAVGRLRRERPLPRLVGVEVREMSGAPVLTAVLERADGSRAVGAALVEGGMPFTLGVAVWEALSDPR
jgi:hypothetical protein